MADKEKDKPKSKLKYAKRTGTPGNYVYWHEDEKKAMVPGDRPKNVDEINSKPRYEHHPHDERATDQVGHKKAAEEMGSEELEAKPEKPKKPSKKESETKMMALKKKGPSIEDRVAAIEKEHAKMAKKDKSFMGEKNADKEKLLKEGKKDLKKKCMKKSADNGEDEYVEIDREKLEKILDLARKHLSKGGPGSGKKKGAGPVDWDEKFKERMRARKEARNQAALGKISGKVKEREEADKKFAERMKERKEKRNQAAAGRVREGMMSDKQRKRFGQVEQANKEKKQRILARLRSSAKEQMKKASGEGSRGGKIIGRTKSGKPIYDKADHPAHKKFTSQDHRDAAGLHHGKASWAGAGSSEENKTKAKHHREQREKHKDMEMPRHTRNLIEDKYKQKYPKRIVPEFVKRPRETY